MSIIIANITKWVFDSWTIVIGIILRRSLKIFPIHIWPVTFHPRFSSGSTVLFRIQKNHYIAIHFWKNDFYKYYFDHIVNPMVPDLYLHLRWVIFHTTEFFSLSPISICMDSTILVLSISGIITNSLTCFFSWSASECKMVIFSMIA